MTDDANNTKLLELASSQLQVPLKVMQAGRTYRVRHILRPPAPADWFAYEAALELAVEELPPEANSDEPCFRLQVRSTDAALELWNRLAVGVEGYDLPATQAVAQGAPRASEELPAAVATAAQQPGLPTAAGSASRLASTPAGRVGGTSEPDWRALIPLTHKEAAIRALTLVAPADPAPDSTNNDSTNNYFPLLADEIPVVLEAAVAGLAYPRLMHCFRPPSVEDERAYRRLQAETLIVRGSRRPRTLIPARLPALVRLYDRLILSADGYALNAQPLASRNQAIQHMDAWHKRVAIQTLFGDLSAEVPQSGTEADLTASTEEHLP